MPVRVARPAEAVRVVKGCFGRPRERGISSIVLDDYAAAPIGADLTS